MLSAGCRDTVPPEGDHCHIALLHRLTRDEACGQQEKKQCRPAPVRCYRCQHVIASWENGNNG